MVQNRPGTLVSATPALLCLPSVGKSESWGVPREMQLRTPLPRFLAPDQKYRGIRTGPTVLSFPRPQNILIRQLFHRATSASLLFKAILRPVLMPATWQPTDQLRIISIELFPISS